MNLLPGGRGSSCHGCQLNTQSCCHTQQSSCHKHADNQSHTSLASLSGKTKRYLIGLNIKQKWITKFSDILSIVCYSILCIVGKLKVKKYGLSLLVFGY